MTRHEPTEIGILGKVPWRDEFVHVSSQGEPFLSFETWLTDGVEWAAARAGSGWPDFYRKGSIHAFVFRPEGDGKGMVAGAIGPSQDSGGRYFPIVIASPLAITAELARSPASLPLVLEDFWALAGQLIIDVLREPNADLAARVASARLPDAESEDVLSSYAEWSRSLPLAELWTLVFGEPGLRVAHGAVRFLLEAVRPYQGEERPTTPLSLRLPLGSAGGAAVCFWIDFVKRAIRWRSTIPSFFWSHDGRTGDVLLHLGRPPRSTVAEMWMPTGMRDEFCDLTRPLTADQVRAVPELPQRLDAVLASERQTVGDLLQAIELGA